ncbi:MAG: class I tRNA ligase family protein, partial [Planctomycetales bacterium]|nr:class I tRNA ligase family protein [Planctomycetales bacterium]
SRLNTVTQQVTDCLEHYRYSDASRTLYSFAWDDFCSFYVEMAKARLSDETEGPQARQLFAYALDTLLRLLHPIMPFITEEIWQRIGDVAPQRGLIEVAPAESSIMRAAWPSSDASLIAPEIEQQFARFQETLGAVRELRSQQNIPPKAELEFQLRCDADTRRILEPLAHYYTQLSNSTPTAWGEEAQPLPLCATGSLPGVEIYLDIREFIDVDAEVARLEKQIGKQEGMIRGKESKLNNASFVDRAPTDVVERERESLAQAREQLETLQNALSTLRELGSR